VAYAGHLAHGASTRRGPGALPRGRPQPWTVCPL